MADRKHSHYFKPCPFTHVDVYRVLQLFAVTDPCMQHAIKKLLVAGGRGAKDVTKDVQEAIDTMVRWQDMRAEEANPVVAAPRPGDVWSTWDGGAPSGISSGGPAGVRGDECVTVRLRGGALHTNIARDVHWRHINTDGDVIAWRRGGAD